MKKNNIRYILFTILFILVSSCSKYDTVIDAYVVKKIDLKKYEGTWYEIARIPIRQEKKLQNVTATYILENDELTVVNSGYTKEKKRKTVYGKAWIPDKGKPGILKVQFFWPFKGYYKILYVDEAYEKALVCGNNLDHIWILCKKPFLNNSDLDNIITMAKNLGADITKLEMVDQLWHLKKK